MKQKTSYWVKTIQNGLIGGGITLLLGLIGMVLSFGKIFVIGGVITMGEIFTLAPIFLEAFLSTRQSPSREPLKLFSSLLVSFVSLW